MGIGTFKLIFCLYCQGHSDFRLDEPLLDMVQEKGI
jgi:hypothetical protein